MFPEQKIRELKNEVGDITIDNFINEIKTNKKLNPFLISITHKKILFVLFLVFVGLVISYVLIFLCLISLFNPIILIGSMIGVPKMIGFLKIFYFYLKEEAKFKSLRKFLKK